MASLWLNSSALPRFEELNGDKETDVLIIGGGITGILCAHMLKQKGTDYILAESSTICSGITKNTTAKITAQHGLVYDKMIKRFGEEKAKLYFTANDKAIKEYQKMCRNIDCDFEERDTYVYSLNDRLKLEKEVGALKRLGIEAEFCEKTPLPFSAAGSIKLKNQAQFNPLKFASSIAESLNIYENTTVRELIGTTAVTDKGRIRAKKIIVATHFPFLNKHGSYYLKMYQHRSYVIAFENAPNVNGMYVDEYEKGMSFRNYKDLLLIGGGDHRTGKKGGGWREIEEFARKHYPNAKEKYRWATQDCMTLDSLPYIGRYSENTENLFVATGFNKWGITSAMVSAMILSDMVNGKTSPYEEVFSPSRTILRPQLAVNAFEAIVNLLTPTTKRCPHMGCALKWNEFEHTWDCPCHGSRFSDKGKLIDNPAAGDIKIKEQTDE